MGSSDGCRNICAVSLVMQDVSNQLDRADWARAYMPDRRAGSSYRVECGSSGSGASARSFPSSEAFVPILRANNIGSLLTHDEPVFVNRSCVSQDQFLRAGDFMIALSSGSRTSSEKLPLFPKIMMRLSAVSVA
jgi:hypothetical protein